MCSCRPIKYAAIEEPDRQGNSIYRPSLLDRLSRISETLDTELTERPNDLVEAGGTSVNLKDTNPLHWVGATK